MPLRGGNYRCGYRPTLTGLAAVAVGRRGVAAVLLGDGRGELKRKLLDALPSAALVEDEVWIAPTLDAVARYVDVPNGELAFDLDLRGEADEIAVWAALRAIRPARREATARSREIGTGIWRSRSARPAPPIASPSSCRVTAW